MTTSDVHNCTQCEAEFCSPTPTDLCPVCDGTAPVFPTCDVCRFLATRGTRTVNVTGKRMVACHVCAAHLTGPTPDGDLVRRMAVLRAAGR